MTKIKNNSLLQGISGKMGLPESAWKNAHGQPPGIAKPNDGKSEGVQCTIPQSGKLSKGAIGDVIRIDATDDFRVTRVRVIILGSDG